MEMEKASSKQLSWSFVPLANNEGDSDLKTTSESLLHFSETQPTINAFVFASIDGNREYVTWKQLYDKSVLVARGLIQLGVKRHEFVAVNVRDCPEWLYINFGIILAGARVANISFTYTDGSDVKAMMEKLGTCSTMVLDAGADDNNWAIFRDLIDEHDIDGSVKSSAMPYLKYLVMLERPANTPNLKTVWDIMDDITSNAELPVLNEDEVVSLFQTSGSTGVPKLAAHTHTSLFAVSKQGKNRRKAEVSSGNVTLFSDKPFAWVGGWPFTALSGLTRVTRSRMGNDPEDNIAFIFDVIQQEKCNVMTALPSTLHAMMKTKALIKDDWPLQYILTGGQPITADLAECAGVLVQNSTTIVSTTKLHPSCRKCKCT